MAVDIQDLKLSLDGLFALLDSSSGESDKRAFISRSYYVIFHIVKQYIEQNLPQYAIGKNSDGVFKTGVHNQLYLVLVDYAEQTNNKNFQKLALQFKDFHSRRCQSDYELEKNISDYDVKIAKKYYESIPNLLDNFKV
ncbi:hypothetical protein [Moraxella nasicaprae]|uniref:HEPN domain-containing protein n=1 Tax=Moraxella nasicaprae TaxID=2904122 RepID=A0ABY6F4A5_9GAMM|nr:hypothetical protein [Moraxella nasicaprae]UXZ04929.1 hypothetical protein LU297_00260 [Moraxella nasicaprae]